MTTRQSLIQQIDAFQRLHGLSDRQFSLMAIRDHKWLGRLRRGQVSLSSIERAEAFMRDHPAEPQPDAVQHAAAQAARRDPADLPTRHPVDAA
ncbi:hypothetical protein [Falsiroseomonas tokyonensis]|uniref:Uncharacterized protein n=1 Tax=Falsiroseomonas tokyonensis TaxID=430521 RepID=A0ABV7C1N8_9PROT|nr:hypothetical protein [Falsiroseomonas tokyonensis]MBU8540839.1 hypothetical protein [Falsiroseomonas tokyonensis]